MTTESPHRTGRILARYQPDTPRTRSRPVLVDVAALAAWTAANDRAREEYRWHPLSDSCKGNHPCPNRRNK